MLSMVLQLIKLQQSVIIVRITRVCQGKNEIYP